MSGTRSRSAWATALLTAAISAGTLTGVGAAPEGPPKQSRQAASALQP